MIKGSVCKRVSVIHVLISASVSMYVVELKDNDKKKPYRKVVICHHHVISCWVHSCCGIGKNLNTTETFS